MLMTAALLASQAMWAQQKNLSGTVVDSQGEPIIGATVKVPGSATGAITDLDGHFSITVNPGTKLEVSYVGMQTVSLTAGDNMHVILKDDSKTLNDVVVIGYGVQKKSVVTASIAKVDAEDLQGKTQLRAEDALKGLAAGVNVTSASGQPGSKSMIRVRGIGTINNSDPLYIIDGMATDQNGMELVNPEDIESIEVLKDAASGAIYGSRAANGVILVTTKKGVKGNAKINYNFSYGWQNAWRKRDVTGATDYAILQNEKYVNGGQAPLYADPYNLTDVNGNAVTGFGTNWQKELFNDNAPIVQHDLSISGASDKVNYYLSMGYMKQEGIVGGNYGQSNYDRLTLRSNTNYTLFDASKDRKYLNKLDLGVNVGYMRVHNTGIDANSTWGSPLGSALYLSPILPVTITKPDVATAMEKQYSAYELYKDGNGNPYTIPGYFGSYNEQNNPIAMMQGHPTRNWSHKIMPKFSLDLQLFDNLKYHFSYSAELSFWGYDGATTQKFYLSGNNNADHTSATSYKGDNNTWQVDNTLSYDKTIGKHSFGIVLGQSASKYKGSELGGGAWDLINANKPSISYTNGNGQVVYSTDKDGKITGATAHFNVWGAPYTEHRLSSLFARMSYNYDERYMAQFTVRRDGSSRFGSDNLYGTFPSFSLGWNIMNEKFMEPTHNWLSNAKVRFSWGKNGNENIGDFAYTTLTSMGYDYYFGTNSVKTHGSKANRLPNPNLKWEESEQTDIGLDLGFFNSALTFTVDYFVKKTNGMIIAMPIPSYVGENSPLANVGDMKNSGWEFELGYKGHIGDFRYSVRGNASYLHNELTNLGNATGFLDWGISQFSDGGTRAQNGQPFPFFYGYKTAGVFQTVDEVNAYKNADGTLIQPNAIPGDLRFVDVNGDGKITSDDRTNIGNGTPKWTFGLNLNAEYKGFDLNVFFQGVSGVDVFDATYRQDIASGNYPTWMLSRWTGPGTSNRVPRLALGDTKNWVVSDLYVRDGSYLRLKTFQLGYTLPRVLTKRVGVDRFRLFVMAENLITWTKYWGFDPEIGSSTTSLGVDYGVYPQARTWSVGFNITL
jgi:TonB-linked SusC/RagA family outer membrane protein